MLLQGLNRTHAVARASSPLGVSGKSIWALLKQLEEGQLGEDVKRGRPSCPHGTPSPSAAQVGSLTVA